jgi:hypothetical protein
LDKEAELARRASAGSAELDLAPEDTIQRMVSLGDRLLIISKWRTYSVRPPDMVDPLVTHENVPWEHALVLPFGVTDPIVARTLIHIEDNARSAGFKQADVEDIQRVTFSILTSLSNMQVVRDRCRAEIDSRIADIEGGMLEIYSKPAKKSIPQVPTLALEFRTFIFETKRVLNELTQLFDVMLGKKVEPAHFHKLLRWAEGKFGGEHQLTSMLRKSQPWIVRVIDFRNMVEHPKEDEYIEIVNFSFAPSAQIQVPHFVVFHPKYRDFPPTDIRELMELFVDSCVNLFEQISACLLVHSQKSDFLAALEPIPEAEINAECPVRYRARLVLPDFLPR